MLIWCRIGRFCHAQTYNTYTLHKGIGRVKSQSVCLSYTAPSPIFSVSGNWSIYTGQMRTLIHWCRVSVKPSSDAVLSRFCHTASIKRQLSDRSLTRCVHSPTLPNRFKFYFPFRNLLHDVHCQIT